VCELAAQMSSVTHIASNGKIITMRAAHPKTGEPRDFKLKASASRFAPFSFELNPVQPGRWSVSPFRTGVR
jgi:hypothetical protein